MIVEDEDEWMKKIIDILHREADFIVDEAVMEQEEAVNRCLGSKTDIILMDIALGENISGGIDVIKTVLREKSRKFIALTCFDDINTIVECFQAGAMDYVLKSELDKLPATIRSVYSSRLSYEIIQQEFKSLVHEQKKLLLLNKEEKVAFDLREKGLSVNQIAREVHKSPHTIKNQFRNMFRRFNVRNFEELNRYINK